MSNYPDNMDWSKIDGPEDDRCFDSIGTHHGEKVRGLIAAFIQSLKDVADPDEGFVFDETEASWIEAAAIDAFSFDSKGDDQHGDAFKAFQAAAQAPAEPKTPPSFLTIAAAIVAPMPVVQS